MTDATPTLLYIDDDDALARLVERGLSRLGFNIVHARDGSEGLKRLEQGGIDPKDHRRIFELFRRAGVQDKPGQGIGLAHVRALVRRLGGTMSVSSELGSGSTFVVTLPINWKFERGYRWNTQS